jgi:ParB-like chromosome segregation protein Spo0J
VDDLLAFRLSVGRPIEPLTESINNLGLLTPLWVAVIDSPKGSLQPVVISGGRRLLALKNLGLQSAPCLAPNQSNLLLAAITANLERGFNQAETVLAWALAEKAAQDKVERQKAWQLLGLAPRDRRLAWLEAAAALPEEALQTMAEGRLDMENAPELMSLDQTERQAVLKLILGARPSKQNRRRWLQWLSDLKRITGRNLELLFTPAILASLTGQDGEKVTTEYLQKLRFPLIAELRDQRRAFVAALGLSPGLRLELDPELEDVTGEVRLSFSEPDELRRLALEAAALSQRPELGKSWLAGNLPAPEAKPAAGPTTEQVLSNPHEPSAA